MTRVITRANPHKLFFAPTLCFETQVCPIFLPVWICWSARKPNSPSNCCRCRKPRFSSANGRDRCGRQLRRERPPRRRSGRRKPCWSARMGDGRIPWWTACRFCWLPKLWDAGRISGLSIWTIPATRKPTWRWVFTTKSRAKKREISRRRSRSPSSGRCSKRARRIADPSPCPGGFGSMQLTTARPSGMPIRISARSPDGG